MFAPILLLLFATLKKFCLKCLYTQFKQNIRDEDERHLQVTKKVKNLIHSNQIYVLLQLTTALRVKVFTRRPFAISSLLAALFVPSLSFFSVLVATLLHAAKLYLSLFVFAVIFYVLFSSFFRLFFCNFCLLS